MPFDCPQPQCNTTVHTDYRTLRTRTRSRYLPNPARLLPSALQSGTLQHLLQSNLPHPPKAHSQIKSGPPRANAIPPVELVLPFRSPHFKFYSLSPLPTESRSIAVAPWRLFAPRKEQQKNSRRSSVASLLFEISTNRFSVSRLQVLGLPPLSTVISLYKRRGLASCFTGQQHTPLELAFLHKPPAGGSDLPEHLYHLCFIRPY